MASPPLALLKFNLVCSNLILFPIKLDTMSVIILLLIILSYAGWLMCGFFNLLTAGFSDVWSSDKS